jgi:hypothetical protein
MATAMFAKTLENQQYLTWLIYTEIFCDATWRWLRNTELLHVGN